VCAYREKLSSALFFKYNTQLGPPYQVLIDTNFINFSIKNKVRAPQRHGVYAHQLCPANDVRRHCVHRRQYSCEGLSALTCSLLSP
jgi:hypothetical protein